MNVGRSSLTRLALSLLLAVAVSVAVAAVEPTYDSSTPLEELKAAASGGDAGAMLELGSRLIEGQGVDTNTVAGLNWLQKAADAGNAQAWYMIGFVYSNGVGVALDIAKSVEYYRKGAEAGDVECQIAMGMICQAGKQIPSGIEADPVEAARWYRMAADRDDVHAMHHLAGLYTRGEGIERDVSEAARWLRKGAELGNSDCLWGLGRCYLRGRGVPQDSVMAYALCFASLEGIEFPEQKKAMTQTCDEMAKLLTPAQLKQAEPIIQEWTAKD